MNPALHDLLLTRLLADPDLDDLTINLVEAACQSTEAVHTALADLGATPSPKRRSNRAPSPTTEPPGAYLADLHISGFRGISQTAAIALTPGPGLTLIVGRNGSGKSSFAEGLETLLTGESGRWSGRRSKLWREGWRNLHSTTAAIEARFVVEGSTALTLKRKWSEDDTLDTPTLHIRDRDNNDTSLQELGWDHALTSFRPFLSYRELGALVDEPSKAFDEIWALLGLHEVTGARDRLTARRKEMDKRKKAVTNTQKQLLVLLAAIDDTRAAICAKCIKGRKWDLGTLSNALQGDIRRDKEDAALPTLRTLARMQPPTPEAITAAADSLREAIEARTALADEAQEQHAALIGVLQTALEYVEQYPDDCPVCERPLPDDFTTVAGARLQRSKRLTEDLQRAHSAVEAQTHKVAAVFGGIDGSALQRAAELGLPADAADAWTAFTSFPPDPTAVVDHLQTAGNALQSALVPLVDAAAVRLQEIEELFRPVAEQLAAWLPEARAVVEESDLLKVVKQAEEWLKDAEVDLRNDRFAPIADRVRHTWTALGHGSHVALDKVDLAGTATRRRIDFEVSVDGTEGAAVAVMSQGELNALALSLFLPRMMLSESPFRFLIIDDPVQAMDHSKVDGLARVLGEAAKTRQVIVLTHDARLLEAVRRLRLEATILTVSRRAQSVVEVRESQGPVEDHLRDAWSLARDEPKVGSEVAGRLVAGFCRSALEAACLIAIRRRRLSRGDEHDEVEETIEDAKGLMELTALALFDDSAKGGEVYKSLDNRLDRTAVEAFKACKEGAHKEVRGDLQLLVNQTRRLAKKLEAAK